LLTVRQVAGILNVSTATVYALVERGDLCHTRVSNGIRFTPGQVEAYLAHGRDRRPPRR
jgi:excisionase family DNA binding protein